MDFRNLGQRQARRCLLGAGRTVGHRPQHLHQWQRQLEHAIESSARVTSPVRDLRKQVHELKRVLAEKTLELDLFEDALQKIEARRQSSKDSGGAASRTRYGLLRLGLVRVDTLGA